MSDLDELTEEELYQTLKSILNPTGRHNRFKFNPAPLRPVSSIKGPLSLRVITAAKIVCKQTPDQTCSHYEISDVLAAAGFDMKPKQVYSILDGLASTGTNSRTPSVIFIKVPALPEAGRRLKGYSDDLLDPCILAVLPDGRAIRPSEDESAKEPEDQPDSNEDDDEALFE